MNICFLIILFIIEAISRKHSGNCYEALKSYWLIHVTSLWRFKFWRSGDVVWWLGLLVDLLLAFELLLLLMHQLISLKLLFYLPGIWWSQSLLKFECFLLFWCKSYFSCLLLSYFIFPYTPKIWSPLLGAQRSQKRRRKLQNKNCSWRDQERFPWKDY